jgi:hypothetical protein
MPEYRVPIYPPMPDIAGIRIGQAVTDEQWNRAALMLQYTRAFGGQVIPEYFPNVLINSPDKHEFTWTIYKRVEVIERQWVLRVRTTTAPSATLTVQAPASGTAEDFEIVPTFAGTVPILYRETLSAASARGSTTLTLGLTCSEEYVVESIACYELPRPVIGEGVLDPQIDLPNTVQGAPIAGTNSNTSLGGVGFYLESFMGIRGGLFEWAVPYQVAGVATNAFALATTAAIGSPDNVFHLGVPVLGRPVGFTVSSGVVPTTRAVTVQVLGRSSDGATAGALKVTAASGGTVTVGMTTPSTWGWYAQSAMMVHTEDVDSADGRRAGIWDDLTFSFYRSAGVGTYYVAAISIYEST